MWVLQQERRHLAILCACGCAYFCSILLLYQMGPYFQTYAAEVRPAADAPCRCVQSTASWLCSGHWVLYCVLDCFQGA